MTAADVRDYPAIAMEYARWAAARRNKGKVCKWVRLAARRHLADLKRSRAKDPAFPFWWDDRLPEFDPTTGWMSHAGGYGWDVCDFIEKLPHVEGIWDTPTLMLEPWEVFILAVVFGWRRRSDDGRRFSVAYIEVARKNGKSPLCSGVALYCLTCDGEPGPQVKCAATTGDQARVVFDVARKMAERTPDFLEAFAVDPQVNSIICHLNGGTIRPINSKASTQDGLNPHLTIIDELHAHAKRDLFDVLRSAIGARRNPLSWYITTAGYNSLGVCYEQRSIVTKILEGVVEMDHYFGIIYTLDGHEQSAEAESQDRRDSEFDEAVWIKANPNLGVSVDTEKLRQYAAEAQVSPESHTEFLMKRMNVWTTAKHAWVNVQKWKKGQVAFDLAPLASVPCYGGLDLASTQDMNALRLVWYVDGWLLTWGRYYLPEAVVEPRTERNNVPYKLWAARKLVVVTPGEVSDHAFIEKDVADVLSRFNLKEIAFDPHGATDLVQRLMSAGANMIEMRQTTLNFSPAMKFLERHYLAGRLKYGDDPVFLWNGTNLVARRDVNDNIAPDRRAAKEKIDGAVACLMGINRLLAHKDDKPSVYRTRGALVIGGGT